MIDFVYSPGATPLDLDESEGLIPQHITTQGELNEWEQANLLEAEAWLSKHQPTVSEMLALSFVKKVHHKMFGKTWFWAGQFRKTNKNIGVEWSIIAQQVKLLVDDVHYQINCKTYEVDEIAARFHHRLVAVHPFANGNGRHARFMADFLLLALNRPRFSWGGKSLYEPTLLRKRYISALRAADKHDCRLLLDFVRK